MQAHQVLLLVLFASELRTASTATSTKSEFVAAVYEHAFVKVENKTVVLSQKEAVGIVMQNMDVYETQMKKAAEQVYLSCNTWLHYIEGPLYFLRDVWMGIFFTLCEAWTRISFFRDSWIYVSHPWESTGFRFFVIPEICIYLLVIFKAMTFARISFHFFKILAWLKFVNYARLDVEPENWLYLVCHNVSRMSFQCIKMKGSVLFSEEA